MRCFEGHTGSVISVRCTTASNDGRHYLMTGSWDNTARLWSLEDGALVRTFEGHTAAVKEVWATADGRHLLTGSGDRTGRLWSLKDGALVRSFWGQADDGEVLSVCTTADGRYMVAGSGKTARRWLLIE